MGICVCVCVCVCVCYLAYESQDGIHILLILKNAFKSLYFFPSIERQNAKICSPFEMMTSNTPDHGISINFIDVADHIFIGFIFYSLTLTYLTQVSNVLAISLSSRLTSTMLSTQSVNTVF